MFKNVQVYRSSYVREIVNVGECVCKKGVSAFSCSMMNMIRVPILCRLSLRRKQLQELYAKTDRRCIVALHLQVPRVGIDTCVLYA